MLIIVKSVLYFVYWLFFNNYLVSTREFCITSIASIVPIVFEALISTITLENRIKKGIAFVTFVYSILLVCALVWTVNTGKQEIIFVIPGKEYKVTQIRMWYLTFFCLLLPNIFNFDLSRKKEDLKC